MRALVLSACFGAMAIEKKRTHPRLEWWLCSSAVRLPACSVCRPDAFVLIGATAESMHGIARWVVLQIAGQ